MHKTIKQNPREMCSFVGQHPFALGVVSLGAGLFAPTANLIWAVALRHFFIASHPLAEEGEAFWTVPPMAPIVEGNSVWHRFNGGAGSTVAAAETMRRLDDRRERD